MTDGRNPDLLPWNHQYSTIDLQLFVVWARGPHDSTPLFCTTCLSQGKKKQTKNYAKIFYRTSTLSSSLYSNKAGRRQLLQSLSFTFFFQISRFLSAEKTQTPKTSLEFWIKDSYLSCLIFDSPADNWAIAGSKNNIQYIKIIFLGCISEVVFWDFCALIL